MSTNVPIQPGRWILALLVPLLLMNTGCSESKEDGDGPATDTTAVVDSTTLRAEADAIVADYNKAVDSLASVLAQINTVEDVERLTPTLQDLSKRLTLINRSIPKYGDLLMESMDKNPVGSSFDRITDERKRIEKMPEVAQKLNEVESGRTDSTEEGM